MKTGKLFRILAGLCIVLSCYSLKAQQPMELQTVIKTALENNLTLEQANNSTLISQLQLKQSRLDFIPSLNAGINANQSMGKYIDNFSFSTSQNPVTITSGVNVSSSYTLFNAFNRWHTLRVSRYNLQAAELARDAMANDICTQVTYSFFQVIYDRENLKITEGKMALLEKQLQRTQSMFDAGTKTQGDVYNVKAQIATEKVNLVNRQNQLNRDELTLVQLMNLDPAEKFLWVAPDTAKFKTTNRMPDLDSVMKYALVNMPDIREKEVRLASSAESIKSAQSALYPTISANFSGMSNYTSNRHERIGTDSIGFPIYSEDPQPYFSQLSGFLYFNIGLSLNVPIFNSYRASTNYQRARINYANSKIEYENTRNSLVKEIQQAFLDANGAKARYDASEEQLVSLEESLRYMEDKYEAGLVDFYAYSEILNTLTQAQVELLTARYDYLLKLKILDLYQGKDLEF